MWRRPLVLLGALACALSLCLPVVSVAGASSALIAIGPAPLVPASLRALSPVDPNQSMHLDIVLRPNNELALSKFVAELSRPGSRLYHRYLAKGQFAELFGPSAASVRALQSTLRGLGLSVGSPSSNGLVLPVSGSARAIEAALHIGIESLAGSSLHGAFASTSAPQLPVGVASEVAGIVGLENTLQASHPPIVPVAATPQRSGTPISTGGAEPCTNSSSSATNAFGYSGTNGPYAADQLASAYNLSSLYGATPADEGSGQTIALYELEADPSLASDFSTFSACYSAVTSSLVTARVDSSVALSSGGLETDLDVEAAAEIAPKANLVVYQAPNSITGAFDAWNQIINTDYGSARSANVISTSWSFCEDELKADDPSFAASENLLFQQAKAQGQTIVAAAGDTGSSCNGHKSVEDPASQPFVTGVGGTTLSLSPHSETVWNNSTGGGGGGISDLWAMPSWQSGTPSSLSVSASDASGSPCGATSGNCREVPDVSAVADAPNGGYLIWATDNSTPRWWAVDGTSGATPLWAGIFALADAYPTCAGSPVGFANPALYAIAGSRDYSSAFNDITSGNNDFGSANGGLYQSRTGYDMASGLGSPNGAALVLALCASVLSMSPAAAISGERVTLSGLGLTGATAVSFGGVSASFSSIENVTATSLSVVVPASVTNGANITVTTPRGTTAVSPADVFNTVSAPVLSSVNVRAAASGSQITLSGSGFSGVTAVNFGSTVVGSSAISLTSDTSLSVTVPSASGTVALSVTDALGTSSTLSFTIGVPSVSSISPASGLSAGTSVTITGSALANATAVLFGTVPGTGLSVLSDGQLSITAPVTTGTVNVFVINAAGSSAATSNDQAAYASVVSSSTSSQSSGGGGGGGGSSSGGGSGGGGFAFSPPVSDPTTTTIPTTPTTSPPTTSPTVPTLNPMPPTTKPASSKAAAKSSSPKITSLSPASGPTRGGISVTIHGSGFIAVTGVYFGSHKAKSYRVRSATLIVAVAPPGTRSLAVSVRSARGLSKNISHDLFSYLNSSKSKVANSSKR